jgi:hypothetical protein
MVIRKRRAWKRFDGDLKGREVRKMSVRKEKRDDSLKETYLKIRAQDRN